MARPMERRGLVAGLGALATMAGVQVVEANTADELEAVLSAAEAQTPSRDAALLAVAAEIEELSLRIDPLWAETHDLLISHPRFQEVERLTAGDIARRRSLVEALGHMPAVTLAGIRAKAAIARERFVLNLDGEPDPEDRLLFGLVDDLAGLSAA